MQALDPCLRIKETSSELFSVSYYKKHLIASDGYLVCSIEGKKTTEGKETIDITQDEPDITHKEMRLRCLYLFTVQECMLY